MNYTPQQTAAMIAAKNRKQLRRQFGLTFQGVEVLLKLANLRAFEKPRATQADVARVLGIDRARVCAHLKRAEAAGLLARVGRTYFFRLAAIADTETQAEIARRIAAMKRSFVRKCRIFGEKSGFVAHRATHTPEDYITEPDAQISRDQALRDLARMYVPVSQRKAL